MLQIENLSVKSIEHLKVSPLSEDLFRYFKIPQERLYEKIKREVFNRYSAIKIRRVKKKREDEIL